MNRDGIRAAVWFGAVALTLWCGAGNAAGGELAELVEAKLAELRVPGAVVGVSQRDKLVFEQAFGVSDVEAGTPMTVDHCFRIGSISKAFLSVVVLQLVDEGKLSLEDRLADYVSDFPNADAISLAELGTMTALVKDPLYSGVFKAMAQGRPERTWTAEEILFWTAKQQPWEGTIGEDWHYSNSAAVLLAEVVEAVCGRPYAEVLRERILARLELAMTGYELAPTMPEPYARGYSYAPEGRHLSRGGDKLLDVTVDSPSLWNAAGAMYSTVDDLRRVAAAVGREELVSADAYRFQTSWRETPWDHHAYGFLTARIHGMIGHDGDVPGYSSFMGYRAADELTVVVLANLHGWPIGAMPANEIAEVVLGEYPVEDGDE